MFGNKGAKCAITLKCNETNKLSIDSSRENHQVENGRFQQIKCETNVEESKSQMMYDSEKTAPDNVKYENT